MALFDWGTYNGIQKIHISEILGMRLTEIPPYSFTRKRYVDEYFRKYGEIARHFNTITAHSPYYSTVSDNEVSLERARKGLITAAKRAEIANAEVFNLHLGGKLDDMDKTVEVAADTIRSILDNTEKINVSLETTYSEYLIGSIEDIKAIIESLNSDRVLISLQLENDWMREKRVYKTGLFHIASEETDKSFWMNLLKKALSTCPDYLSLRFSQVTGIKLRRIVVKKRVPLGMGYPKLETLVSAIADFVVKKIYDKGLQTKIHFIYTGIPDTKYKDCLNLYSSIAKELIPLLE